MTKTLFGWIRLSTDKQLEPSGGRQDADQDDAGTVCFEDSNSPFVLKTLSVPEKTTPSSFNGAPSSINGPLDVGT